MENRFTVQVYRKPVYSTSVQKTSLQYKCTEIQFTVQVYIQKTSLQYKCTKIKECTGTDITHQSKDIEYHTDRTLHSTGNVQGQTHIKINFNFVQGHSL